MTRKIYDSCLSQHLRETILNLRKLDLTSYEIGDVLCGVYNFDIGATTIKLFIKDSEYNTRKSSEWTLHYLANIKNVVDIKVDNHNSKIVKKQGVSVRKSLDYMFEDLIARQEEIQFVSKEKSVYLESDCPIGIIFLEDMHIGSHGVDYKAVKKIMELLEDTPNLFLALGGDLIDNFIAAKMLKEIEDREIEVIEQIDMVDQIIERIQHKVLWMVRGNHELRTLKAALTDPTETMAKKHNLINLGPGGQISLWVNNVEYKVFHRHRARGQGAANRFNAHKRIIEERCGEMDVVVLGHHHEAGVSTINRLGKTIVAINCPTFKFEDKFSDEIGCFYTGLKIPMVILQHDRKSLLTLTDMFDGGLDALEALSKGTVKKLVMM